MVERAWLNAPGHRDAALRSFPRKPYPCYDGVKKTMEVYDSNEMRRHTPHDFYDDSLMRELDESGFLDRLYK